MTSIMFVSGCVRRGWAVGVWCELGLWSFGMVRVKVVGWGVVVVVWMCARHGD